MRVLLTRAAEDAARTRTILESLGHRVLVSPVIAIEPIAAAWPGGVVDAVLATSGQAFATLSDDWGPSPEARRLMPLWLVGHRTEAAARTRGFLGAPLVAPNAVTLAFDMGKRRSRNRVVYLAGQDRKPDIETALMVTEQSVEVVEVYKARAAERLAVPALEAIGAGTLDAVLHFSRRSAVLFLDLARTAGLASGVLHVCLSADVAEPLAEAGWSTRIASDSSEDGMIEALAT